MRQELFAFVLDRVSRGYLDPRAFTRASKILPSLPHGGVADPRSLDPRPRLESREVAFGLAAAFTAVHHRHHAPPVGHLFSLGAFHGTRLCGVAMVGRPVARQLDDGRTLEITRVAVDGTRNACSSLLGAARREARKRGFSRIFTYTLAGEAGASLRAAGFVHDGTTAGGSWSRRGRARHDAHPLGAKTRWRG
jgi:hypothetical protein